MTVPNILYNGIIDGCITNVFDGFSLYLLNFITLEPFVFKNYERNFYVSRFCCFYLLVTESH